MPYSSGKEALAGFNDVASICSELASLCHPAKNMNLTPGKVSVCSNTEVYILNGALSHIRRICPRRWLKTNNRLEILEPFESLFKEARRRDELFSPVVVSDRVLAGSRVSSGPAFCGSQGYSSASRSGASGLGTWTSLPNGAKRGTENLNRVSQKRV